MSDTWVLLRGLTRERGHWGDFIPAFSRALPQGSTLLSPDLPGNGALHGQASPDKVADMVRAFRAGLAADGHAPPYRLLAMSLGAMVAIEWARQHPGEVEACVLINTSVRPFSRFWQRLRPRNYLAILRLALIRPDASALERAVMRMTSRHPPAPQATLARWVALRHEHPVSLGNAWRQLRAAIGYQAPAHPPPVPLLVLLSAADGLVDPRCSEALARHWAVPFRRHPSAGHDLPLDDAGWVARQVMDWLKTQKLDTPA